MFTRCSSFFAMSTLLLVSFPTASNGSESPITMERIMSDPEWIGDSAPSWFGAAHPAYWSADGRHVYFELKVPGERRWQLYRIASQPPENLRQTARMEAVSDADSGSVEVENLSFNEDRSAAVYANHNDLFVVDLPTRVTRQLTRTPVSETAPQFLADGRRIAFQRSGTVFVRDLESGLETQPFDLRSEDHPDDHGEPKPAPFLEAQQERLFEVIRERQEDQEQEKDRDRMLREVDPSRTPNPWYLGADRKILRSSLSPTGDQMLVVTSSKGAKEGRKDSMPVWVTESGYVENEEVRVKVGTDDGSGHELVFLDTESGQRTIDFGSLPGITSNPLAFLETTADRPRDAESATEPSESDSSSESEPRPVRVERIEWHPHGKKVAVQLHSRDNKDRWIVVLDSTEEASVIHRLEHPAWINWYHNEMGWFGNQDQLWFLSEETGYSHLYLHDLESGETKALTSGRFVVSDPQPSPDDRFVYFTANRSHPGNYEIFRVEVASGEVEQITDLGGSNSAKLSPTGTQLLVTHSTVTKPPELLVQPATPGGTARALTKTTSAEFDAVDWVAPEIVEIPSSHQPQPIYSRLYPSRSPDRLADDRGLRPAVIFVHGAGYLQNAHQGWSGYFREFMFHSLLSEHGYIVLDMDYRASRGYGAAWRTAIYRDMGQPELEDLTDGVHWLTENHQVDPDRIGVYGGSYGGFLTLMALFKQPDLFACGAALRPVTDWAHYNHPYTSNILNTPRLDPEAYARSSPIEFAEGLDKPLLICAPMLDDNVLFQDTVRLAQRLIELEKVDWEVALFPVEPHGFRQPSSWLNEYRRIFDLFERNLQPLPSAD